MYAVRMEKSGRVVIPAEIRKHLGLVPGEDVLLSFDEHGVQVVGTRASVLARLREELKEKLGDVTLGRLVSEELIAGRRAEAEREEHER